MSKAKTVFAVVFLLLQITHCALNFDNCEAQWEQTNGPYGGDVNALASSGGNIFAGTNTYGVYLTTNNGINWTQTALNNQNVYSLAVSGSNIFAGAHGVYLSTNNGTSWTQTTLNNQTVISLAISDSNIFAGTNTYGVYLSTNNGTSWNAWNSGFPASGSGVYVSAILIAESGYVFAGTQGNSVLRRSLSQVGVTVVSSEIPKQFSLSQNYPNPFNPSTKIRFEIPKASTVKLHIYDALGKSIATLADGAMQPGVYEAEFNGQQYSLPSGVYFYRLETGDYNTTKKLVLLK